VKRTEDKIMVQKEMEKQNFILWYSLYATEKELEMARSHNREILDRLLREYSEDVDRIEKTRRFYDQIVQSKNLYTQGVDATLTIDYSLQTA
jgi:hypothetical protein